MTSHDNNRRAGDLLNIVVEEPQMTGPDYQSGLLSMRSSFIGTLSTPTIKPAQNNGSHGVYEATREWQEKIFETAKQAVDRGVILTVDGEVAIEDDAQSELRIVDIGPVLRI